MRQDPLKRFLVTLPEKLAYQKTSAIRANLYKALYYGVSNDGEFLKTLFPFISDVEIMELDGYGFDIDFLNAAAFFDIGTKSTYSHPKGTTCARPLKKGEPVYRCEECGFDNTCVLCVHCFNENDHVGHSVQMYIANDKTEGICDCGDAEAFVADLHCKCQYITDPKESLVIPEVLENSVKVTLRIVLDYILDVANFSIPMLPFIHNNINKPGSKLTSEVLSDLSSLSVSKYGVQDVNSVSQWNLILWNDEYHNFPEATNAIRAATGVDQTKADKIATDINNNGRCVLDTASSPDALFEALDAVEAGGLVATIQSARDYFREEIVHHMVQWLSDMLTFNNGTVRELVRRVLGDLLLEPNYTFSKTLPSTLIDGFSINVRRRCFENGLLYNGEFVNLGLSSIKPDLTAKDLHRSTHLILEPPPDTFRPDHSRIQLLLAFSMRFTSAIRKNLTSVIIPPVMIDTHKKAMFCQQYVQIYPQLITSLALSDREEHLTCVSEIATQLLTCPTSVQNILEDDKIGFIFGPLIQLIEEHAGKWNYESGYPNFHQSVTEDSIRSRALYEAISRGILDLTHIVDANLSSTKTYLLLRKSNLCMVILFLRNFQGYWTLERKYGDHVEREILDFVIHLRYSVPVLKIAKLIAESKTDDVELIQSAAHLVMNYLMMRKIDQKAPGIANFKISKEAVSFVHPLNTFLSYLIQSHEFSHFIDVIKSLNPPFMTISDVSLRAIVLGAQVKIGFWIRNGVSVSRQATLYVDSVMSDLAYRRDIHLNQIACLFDDPKTTLYNFLDRWELLEWFTGDVSHDKTVYEDRFNSIVEKFILFIYSLITDRSSFIRMSKEKRLSTVGRKAISYSLSEAPKSYSVLKEEIDAEINQHPDFDKWLAECADYQPPTSLVDSGMYRLKPELYSELDPYSSYLDSSRIQDVSDSIVKYISKVKKIPENELHLYPQIIESSNEIVNDKIANFTKTTYFAKLLYKLLQVSLDTKDETYLPHLLHLLHAILLDEEDKSGQNGLPEAFVDMPISDLLLNVVDSTLSKATVVKADFLLSQFISKDIRVIESLKDCFGEDHIQSYIARKSGLFESESEKRKRLAKERNAKVLKKFERKRKKFLDKNAELSASPSMNKEPESEIGKRNCVLCGEPESTDQVFGILGSSVNSSILWKLPQDDLLYFKLAFTDWDQKSDTFEDGVYGRGYHYSSKQNYLNSKKYDAAVASTCGHGMHYHCYCQAGGRSNHFACPLCHTIQNMFIPSYLPPSDGGGLTEDQLLSSPINNRYNKITHSSSTFKSQDLMKSTLHEDLLEASALELRRNLSIFCDDFMTKFKRGELLAGASKKIKFFNILAKLCILIADTIRMTEITSRLEGEKGYTDFLQMIPNSTKTLLKSLIQCRAILFELREMPSLLASKDDLVTQIESFWDSDYLIDGAFNEVVMLFFQTDESFTTLARLGMSKMFTICFYSIVLRCLNNSHFNQIAHFQARGLDEQIVKDLDKIFEYGKNSFEANIVEATDRNLFFTCVYYSVEKCMVPFFRQLLIFKDILTSKNEGDNRNVSTTTVSNIKYDIEEEPRLDSSEALCHKLNIPTLKELVAGLARGEEERVELEFEYKIHDIVLHAKIPKYLEAGVLTIDYPGVIKLIELPEDYMSCLMDYNEKTRSGVYDNYVCLHCGAKLPTVKFYKHMKKCSGHTCIFFHPSKNLFRIITHIGLGPLSVVLPGPYLTIHGEVKEPRTSGKATLNEFRYKDLNKAWLNQTLYGFITRTLYGSRATNGMTMNNVNFNFPMTPGVNTDGSSDEEDEYFYSPFAW